MKKNKKFFQKINIFKFFILIVILIFLLAVGMYLFVKNTERYNAVWKLRHSYNNLSKSVREAYNNDGNSWNFIYYAGGIANRYKKIPSGYEPVFLSGKVVNESAGIVLQELVELESGELIGIANQIIFIDTNGFAAPNTIGKDIYAFVIAKNFGLVPYAYNFKTDLASTKLKDVACTKKAIYGGMTCSAVIFYNNWKMPFNYPW